MRIEKRNGWREQFRVLYPAMYITPGVKLFLLVCLFAVVHLVTYFVGGSHGDVVLAETIVGFTADQEEQLKKLLSGVSDKHKSLVESEVKNALKTVYESDEFAAKMRALGLEEKTIEKINDAIEKQGLKLQELGEKTPVAIKSLDELLKEKSSDIVKLASGDARQFKMTIPGEVVKTLVQRSAVSGSTQAMRLPEIGQLPYLGAVMTNVFRHAPVSPDSNGVIRYMDQANITRAADMKAEAAEAPESEIDWIERTLALEKIMDSIPVSHESFRDVLFIRSEVERLLNVNLALKEDQQLYAGSGIAPQIKGVSISATAYDGSSLDDSVDSANVYDLIAAVRVIMTNSKKSKYAPNFVLMNPLDIFKYKVLKGDDGHYLLPPFVGPDGKTVDSMPIIESSQVPANELVVGDSRYGTIYDLEDVQIEMGYVDDQFTKDTMTIKARKRMTLLIRNVDADGFTLVNDITAGVAALETP